MLFSNLNPDLLWNVASFISRCNNLSYCIPSNLNLVWTSPNTLHLNSFALTFRAASQEYCPQINSQCDVAPQIYPAWDPHLHIIFTKYSTKLNFLGLLIPNSGVSTKKSFSTLPIALFPGLIHILSSSSFGQKPKVKFFQEFLISCQSSLLHINPHYIF